MKVTSKLSVKGISYYKADELLRKCSLPLGLPILLKHQPDNPYDKNAVAVLVKNTGAMLGHLPKEVAPKYAALINTGRVIETTIDNISKNGSYINIDIKVVYEQTKDQLTEKQRVVHEKRKDQLTGNHNSLLWESLSSLPTGPGVYAIRNTESGRQYIGSSKNIKDRIRTHIKELSSGCHANRALQKDFSNFGINCFEAHVLASGVAHKNLTTEEANQISRSLNLGKSLYNMTADGQGTWHHYHGAKPISDRMNAQSDDVGVFGKTKTIETLESRKAASPPQKSFWSTILKMFFG